MERVDLKTGAVEVLYRGCGDVPLKGPNDLVFDAHGGIYFTDLGKRRPREMDIGAVYYAKADGSSITEVAYPMVTPNGIGLSPDGGTLYVAETEAARLWAFPIEAPGVVKKEPWPSPHGGRLVAGIGGYQRFDSLAVQEDGRICVATLINGGITDHFAGRQTHRAPSDARSDDDQHLLWRPRHEDRLHHAVMDRAARRRRLAGRRAEAQPGWVIAYPAAALTGTGPVSAASSSSIVRPRVSMPTNRKPTTASRYQAAK